MKRESKVLSKDSSRNISSNILQILTGIVIYQINEVCESGKCDYNYKSLIIQSLHESMHIIL